MKPAVDLSSSAQLARVAAREARSSSRLGALALKRGLVDKEQLRKTLRRQRALRKRERVEARVGELLVAARLLDAEQLTELLAAQGNPADVADVAARVRALRKQLRASRRRRKAESTPTPQAVVASVDSADVSQDADLEEPVDPYREQSNEFLAWLQESDPKAYRLIKKMAQRLS